MLALRMIRHDSCIIVHATCIIGHETCIIMHVEWCQSVKSVKKRLRTGGAKRVKIRGGQKRNRVNPGGIQVPQYLKFRGWLSTRGGQGGAVFDRFGGEMRSGGQKFFMRR